MASYIYFYFEYIIIFIRLYIIINTLIIFMIFRFDLKNWTRKQAINCNFVGTSLGLISQCGGLLHGCYTHPLKNLYIRSKIKQNTKIICTQYNEQEDQKLKMFIIQITYFQININMYSISIFKLYIFFWFLFIQV